MSMKNPQTSTIALAILLQGCIDYGLTGPKDSESSPSADDPIEAQLEEPVVDPPQEDTGDPDPGDGQVVTPEDPEPDPDPDPDPEPEPDPCDGDQVTRRLDLTFDAMRGCQWEAGENLSPVDAYVRAVETDRFEVPLPDEVVVCDVRFEFARSEGGMAFSLQYDDQLMLTLNDRIIFSTDRRLAEVQSVDADGLPVFDWLTARDMEMDFHPDPWALGADYELDMPPHDVLGDAFIAIDDAALSTLRTAATEELRFDLHSFGDNDESDCGHTGLGFWVEVDVAAP